MKPRSLTLTLTLAFLSSYVASSLPPPPSPSPSPSPFRSPPKQTTSDPTGIHLLPPPPPPPPPPAEGSVHHRQPPARKASSGRTGEFGRKMGLVLAGVALLLQVVFGGFLVYKRIQLREGFSALPSTTTS